MKKEATTAITGESFYRFNFATNELAIVIRHGSGKETVTPIKEFRVLKNDQLLMVTLADGEQVIFDVPQPPSVEEVSKVWKAEHLEPEWNNISEGLWKRAIAMTQESITLKEAWYRIYFQYDAMRALGYTYSVRERELELALLATFGTLVFPLEEEVTLPTVIGELSLNLEVVGYVDVPGEIRSQFFFCERSGDYCLVLGEAAIAAGFPDIIDTRKPFGVMADTAYAIYVGEDGLTYCCNWDLVDEVVLKTWYPWASDLDDLTDDQENEHIDRMLLLIKS